jgi:hypothetical protein
MVLTALLLGIPAAISGGGSTFIWLDVGVCLVLAAVLFLVGVRGYALRPEPPPGGRREAGGNPHRWRDTALVLSAVITIVSPAVKFLVELGGTALEPTAAEQRECTPAPPAEDQPS